MLTKAILGTLNLDSGEIYINGKKVKINSPADAVKMGIGYISDDKNNVGLFNSMNFISNLTIGHTKKEHFFVKNNSLVFVNPECQRMRTKNVSTC